VITGSSLAAVEEFKEEMKKALLMSDLRLLSFYLGIEVRQDARGITLRQAHYAKKIMEMANTMDCKAATTPMEERLRMSRDSTVAEVDVTQYRRNVGSLRYLLHTQPDLSYAVGYVSRFLERPTEEHLQAMQRVLSYIVGTLEFSLCHRQRTGAARLMGYCDKDLAGDIDTRKSTIDSLFFHGNCLVSWQSLKQRVVALSSCEAEDITAIAAATQAIWMAQLLVNF
jgi:hypothetical protein